MTPLPAARRDVFVLPHRRVVRGFFDFSRLNPSYRKLIVPPVPPALGKWHFCAILIFDTSSRMIGFFFNGPAAVKPSRRGRARSR